MGTAVLSSDADTDEKDADITPEHAKEEPLSVLPFVLIIGAGIILLGLLGYLMRKIIKS